MQRRYRLTENAEFQRVRQQGRQYPNPLLVLYVRPGDAETTRFGISVSRSIGKAVARNRVKRRIREALRLRQAAIAPGWELLFIARRGAAAATFRELSEAVEQSLRRAGVLSTQAPAEAAQPGRSAGMGRAARPGDE